MVQRIFFKMESIHPESLAILGWLAFVTGVLVKLTWLKLILMSAARVLP
jgi:hypothetical protein